MVVFAVTLQITFDYTYLKEDVIGYFVLFLPRQVGIFTVVCLYWYLAVMEKALTEPNAQTSNSLEPNSLDVDTPTQKPKELADKQYLELEHMGRPYRLDMDSVWIIKSAGNYLELESEHGHFLKRASLKQIQVEIPGYFCQCHRSNIINLHHVCAIRNQNSGHAVAILSNGEQVNISKRYKSIVKQRLVEFPLQTS
jgi:DNA-binding LytR/AlgR family response regulator